LNLVENVPSTLTPFQTKSLYHQLKLSFQSLSKMIERTNTFYPLIMDSLKALAEKQKVKKPESAPQQVAKKVDEPVENPYIDLIYSIIPQTAEIEKISQDDVFDIVIHTLENTPMPDIEKAYIKWQSICNAKTSVKKKVRDPRMRNQPTEIDESYVPKTAENAKSILYNLLKKNIDVDPETLGEKLLVPLSRTIDEPFVLSAPPLLSEAQCFNLTKMAFQRMFDQEHPMSFTYKARSMWMQTLVRSLNCIQGVIDRVPIESLFNEFVKYLFQDFRTHCDLGLLWIHSLYTFDLFSEEKVKKEESEFDFKHKNDTQMEVDEPKEMTDTDFPTYKQWCLVVLKQMKQTLDPKDRTFTKFLLEIPRFLKDPCLSLLYFYYNDSNRLPLSLASIRDLIAQRPCVRRACVDLMCILSFSNDKTKRSAAVILVKKFLLEYPAVQQRLEEFSLKQLLKLKMSRPPSQMENSDLSFKSLVEHPESFDLFTEEELAIFTDKSMEVEEEWTENEINRYLELYFVLCMKRQDVLLELFKVYSQIEDQFVQKVIRTQMTSVIRTLEYDSPAVREILQNYPDGSELAVLRMLILLAEKGTFNSSFVRMVLRMIDNRDLDGRFYLPLLTSFSKEQAVSYLPRILAILNNGEMERRIVSEMINRLIEKALSPSELLIQIHVQESEIGLKRAIEGK
jgi:hypothetical protein